MYIVIALSLSTVVCYVRGVVLMFFFFFKQKTAYEMLRSLVGSEMCIRDRRRILHFLPTVIAHQLIVALLLNVRYHGIAFRKVCLLYTSDAADDLLCVDLGGRRII